MYKSKNTRILLIASIILTVISAAITYYNVLQKKQSTARVIRTYHVIETARQMLTLVNNLKTNAHVYLLTHDSSFLEPIKTEWSELDEKIKALDSLLAYSTKQKELVESHLIPLVDIERKKIQQSIETARTFKDSNTVAEQPTSTLMDSTTIYINALIANQQEMLVSRNKNLQSVYLIGDIIRSISFSLIGLTSVCALFVIRRHERLNKELMQDLQELNAGLEKKVSERTLQLEKEKNNSIMLNHELQEILEETRSLHSALVDANQKLVKLNEEKDHFLGVTTHDLKSPLVGIRGLLKLLKLDGNNLTDKQKDYVTLMDETCQSMQRLVTDLLDLKRIEQGATQVDKKDVRISTLLDVIQNQFTGWLASKNLSLEINNEYGDNMFHTDPHILSRILDNLLSNAIKFSSPGKKIRITIQEKNSELFFHITDQGPGIQAEEQDKLFTKFQRLSAVPTAGETSSGLGLSIVKELVHILDGNIKVQSDPDKGSTFTLIFQLNN